MNTMICAWCGKTVQSSHGIFQTDNHGICEACKSMVINQWLAERKERKIRVQTERSSYEIRI